MRLLGEANRHGNDPELFAGLVHACRYCGLFEAVDRRARRGAPARPERPDQPRADAADDGDIDRLLAIEPPPFVAGGDEGIRVIGLGLAGRRDEARRGCSQMRQALAHSDACSRGPIT